MAANRCPVRLDCKYGAPRCIQWRVHLLHHLPDAESWPVYYGVQATIKMKTRHKGGEWDKVGGAVWT